jgi:enoyl-CoA hydratase/carnithine racemase
MERQFVKVEKGLGPHGRIAVVRFDRGDNINAFSRQAMRELRDVPRDFEDDLATSVVILTGSAKAFSAGFDLKDPEGGNRGKLPLGEALLNQRPLRRRRRGARRLARLPLLRQGCAFPRPRG